MDRIGGLPDGDLWDDSFVTELIRLTDVVEATRNPNLTPTPVSIHTHDPFAANPASSATYLPSSSVSCPPAASHPSPPHRFSPPPVLGGVGAKRDREVRELKRELKRVCKQMNELENECTQLRKDITKKDLQIKAKDLQIKAQEAEIQNLKKANVPSKDVCSAGMDIDQSFHAPANGALHAGGSSRTSTRQTDKTNGKDKDVHSLQDDSYLKQGHQTDLPEASHHN